jgi:hypothetical protein
MTKIQKELYELYMTDKLNSSNRNNRGKAIDLDDQENFATLKNKRINDD